MAKKPSTAADVSRGKGDELHQTAGAGHPPLTTNQGVVISDNQNSLTVGARGPTLLEDFVLREKIMHFDHERIPERIVHARGSAAHGFFEVYKSLSKFTKADFLQRPGEKTKVFARFSTVAGGAGSGDTPRDVRGFAVKFYTNEGNFDLVGNNIPVFFIQDAIKFPDLIHSVKMEPDRGFPQAASAHDTFWDFISLMPESIHMATWAMSDRAIPRSVRFMEGFGIHTFRLVDAKGKSTFCKFHWRPKQGMQSLIWNESVKIYGADFDYHRRDLWEAIERGDYPEWELGLQLFSEEEANDFDFDVLDPTKIIPEEVVPLTMVGRLVLDRNPDNFFAETEQVAYCPANIVPGIDFSDDPLLQGRLFSYLDTQLKRLGSPNFHEIPINQPICPMQNFQRDGHMRQTVNKGRVNYEPNSLGADGPRECPQRGFTTYAAPERDGKTRIRPESFADHYSQARQFYRSQTETEQGHIASAFTFELSKVETPAIRQRVVSHLVHVDPALARQVADGLNITVPKPADTAVEPIDLPPSPPLSIIAKAPKSISGRTVACLVTDDADAGTVAALRKAVEAEGGVLMVIAQKVGGPHDAKGKLAASPSVLFDAVALVVTEAGADALAKDPDARDFVADAWRHLKVIGHAAGAAPLLEAAGISPGEDEGVVPLGKDGVTPFIDAAKSLRVWAREKRLAG
ncbi:catalase [Emcibacter sp. SYSU 3D8]|uniref:catalase n=1 Tax=Emcibacter sp. SYSU 3D8 TaxID=3133969 RepID=UPI0031FECE82